MSRSRFFYTFASMALLASVSVGAHADPIAACSLLTADEVRAVIGAPVTISVPSSHEPRLRGQTTLSNCAYAPVGAEGRGASVVLMWAPPAKLTETQRYYQKRRKEAVALHGDMLVLTLATTTVSAGSQNDMIAGKKLLDAVIAKLDAH